MEYAMVLQGMHIHSCVCTNRQVTQSTFIEPWRSVSCHHHCISQKLHLWNLAKSQMNMKWSSVLQQIKNIPGCWIEGKICKEESQPIRRGLSSNILHISLPASFKVYLNLAFPFVNHLMLPQKTKHYILFFLTLVCRVVFRLW